MEAQGAFTLTFARTIREKHLNGRFPSLEQLYPREFKEKHGETLGAEEDFRFISNENPHLAFRRLQYFADFHNLKAGNRLLFTYEGRCHFHVVIYRNNATGASSSAASEIATTVPAPVTAPRETAATTSAIALETGMTSITPRASMPAVPVVLPASESALTMSTISPASDIEPTMPTMSVIPSASDSALIVSVIPHASESAPAVSVIFPPASESAPIVSAIPPASESAPTVSVIFPPASESEPTVSVIPPTSENARIVSAIPPASESAPTVSVIFPPASESEPTVSVIPPTSENARIVSAIPPASESAPTVSVIFPPASESEPTLSVIPPASESAQTVRENMKNAARSQAQKNFKHRHPYGAPRPAQIRPPVRTRAPLTRLGAGALRPINYSEDAPAVRLAEKKRRHRLDEDARDPPEVREYKKRCRAGFSLQQHLDLLPETGKGSIDCNPSAEGESIVTITIQKTAAGSLLIEYCWSSTDLAFASKWGKLLFACNDKDVLLSNQQGKKWRVWWNPGDKEVDHSTTGWSAFVAHHNLQAGDRCNLMVLHTKPIEFGFTLIRKPGNKSPGCRITRLLQKKREEKTAFEGLEKDYGSEGELIAMENRQLQFRSHFHFDHDLSDTGKFGYCSDCPGKYARVTPYPQTSRLGKKLHPRERLQPGVAMRDFITKEYLKATPSEAAGDMAQHGKGKLKSSIAHQSV